MYLIMPNDFCSQNVLLNCVIVSFEFALVIIGVKFTFK